MNISVNLDDLEIRVDRRTELLSIIEIISDYGKKYPFLLEKYGNEKYVNEIEETFKKFREHQVVQLFNYLTLNYDFSFSIPIQLFLQLNDDFTVFDIPNEPFKTRLQEDGKVIRLLSLLSDFAKEINFNMYYSNHEYHYRRFIDNIRSQLVGLNIVQFMNNYLNGQEKKEYIVNLIPWRTYGCYGTHNGNKLYTNLCCHHKSKSEIDMYPADDHIFNYSSFLVHEFSHSFINPLTDKYPFITEEDAIFDNIRDKMKELGYGSNKSILRDHIVRAITLRYLFLERNNISYYEKQLKTDEIWGFEYIKNIYSSLEIYEKNRTQYIDIEEFYPIIIRNIIRESEKTKINKAK